jgi:hypothetical protein
VNVGQRRIARESQPPSTAIVLAGGSPPASPTTHLLATALDRIRTKMNIPVNQVVSSGDTALAYFAGKLISVSSLAGQSIIRFLSLLVAGATCVVYDHCASSSWLLNECTLC